VPIIERSKREAPEIEEIDAWNLGLLRQDREFYSVVSYWSIIKKGSKNFGTFVAVTGMPFCESNRPDQRQSQQRWYTIIN